MLLTGIIRLIGIIHIIGLFRFLNYIWDDFCGKHPPLAHYAPRRGEDVRPLRFSVRGRERAKRVSGGCAGMASPFCAAKGGRVKRSETQGVHTPITPPTLNPLQFPLEHQGGGERGQSQPITKITKTCPVPRYGITVQKTMPLSWDERGASVASGVCPGRRKGNQPSQPIIQRLSRA